MKITFLDVRIAVVLAFVENGAGVTLEKVTRVALPLKRGVTVLVADAVLIVVEVALSPVTCNLLTLCAIAGVDVAFAFPPAVAFGVLVAFIDVLPKGVALLRVVWVEVVVAMARTETILMFERGDV